MTTQAYGYNGTTFTLQPTTGRWMRTLIDMTGDGHPIYADVLQFDMYWQLTSPEDAWEFHKMYSGTYSGQEVTVSLPEYGYPAYQFHNYSGCAVSEPEYNVYFSEQITEVKQTIYNIRL